MKSWKEFKPRPWGIKGEKFSIVPSISPAVKSFTPFTKDRLAIHVEDTYIYLLIFTVIVNIHTEETSLFGVPCVTSSHCKQLSLFTQGPSYWIHLLILTKTDHPVGIRPVSLVTFTLVTAVYIDTATVRTHLGGRTLIHICEKATFIDIIVMNYNSQCLPSVTLEATKLCIEIIRCV